jgi:hypothetical protein
MWLRHASSSQADLKKSKPSKLWAWHPCHLNLHSHIESLSIEPAEDKNRIGMRRNRRIEARDIYYFRTVRAERIDMETKKLELTD